jgi:hypothetical protein
MICICNYLLTIHNVWFTRCNLIQIRCLLYFIFLFLLIHYHATPYSFGSCKVTFHLPSTVQSYGIICFDQSDRSCWLVLDFGYCMAGVLWEAGTDDLGSPLVCWRLCVVHLFSFLCCVLWFDCLRLVSCVLCLVYPMLPVYLACPFLICHSVFSNVYWTVTSSLIGRLEIWTLTWPQMFRF